MLASSQYSLAVVSGKEPAETETVGCDVMGDENVPPGRLSAMGTMHKVSELYCYETDVTNVLLMLLHRLTNSDTPGEYRNDV